MRKVISILTRDYNVSEEFWLGTVKDETALTELETFYRQLFDRKIEEYTPNEWMTLDQDHYLVRGTLPESAARRKIYRDRAWAMYNRKYAIPQHLIDYHPKLKSRIKLDGTTRPLPEYGNDFFTIEDVHPLLSPAPPRDTPGWQRFKGRMSGKLRLPDGEPYVLYHGTGNAGFAEFDPERFNPFVMWNAGIYLTDSPEVAGGIGDWQLDVERYKTRAEAEQAGFVGDYEIEQDEAGAWIMRKNRFVSDESGYVMTGMYNLIVPE